MKKIALFLPNLQGGGAEKVALLLANEFILQDYNVDMVLCNAEGEFLSALHNNIKVIDLKAVGLQDIFKSLLRYLRNEKPDALLALMWPLTLLAVAAFKLARLPGRVVVSDHTTFSQSPLLKSRPKRWIFRGSLRVVYPWADARLAVSNGVSTDLVNLGMLNRDSIEVIYNPVSSNINSLSEEESKDLWRGFKGKKVVAVGALKWAKNYPALLEAFAILLQEEKAMLSIVGRGELLSKLENKSKQLGIDANVQYVGFSDAPFAWMESADLLVLSSHYEGFGNVLVEAMSVGTPVVSTDCKSGPREILDNGKYGKLVPVNDINALAQAMLESLQQKHDVEVLKLRAADFSVDKVANKYLDVMFPN